MVIAPGVPGRDHVGAIGPRQPHREVRADGLRRGEQLAHAWGSSKTDWRGRGARCRTGRPGPTPAGCRRWRTRATIRSLGLLVGHRVVDRVKRQQRVAGEVHLGDQPLGERAAEEAEVDVRGPPGVVVVAPRVGAGLDRDEPVAAALVGDRAADAGEVRVERGGVVLAACAGSGRPRWSARSRPACPAPGGPPESRTWPNTMIRCPCGSPACWRGQVGVLHGDQVVAQQRPGHLGEPLRQQHQRLLRVPERGRLVAGEVERRVIARLGLRVLGQDQLAGVRGR